MQRLNAKDVGWIGMEICGVSGFFSDMRILRESVPKDFIMYELRDENDGMVWQYKSGILVNFMGTFICKQPLPEGDGYVDEEDWTYTEDRHHPL